MEVVIRSKEQHMALNEPVLSGPGAGRTVTYGGGSSAELKLAGEQSGGDWAVVEWRGRAGGETGMPHHTPQGENVDVAGGGARATNRRCPPPPARTKRCTSSRARSPPTSVTRRSRWKPGPTRRSRRT